MAKKSTYYQDTIPKLIKRYKMVIDQCLLVLEEEIDKNIADDKLYNVLKSKRMASEDIKFYAKEIDVLENEINGIHVTEKVEKTGAEAFTVEK